jgi:DNA-binding response OmpR family regulator
MAGVRDHAACEILVFDTEIRGPTVVVSADVTLNILLVDDDVDFRVQAAESLREEGHHVCVAVDGASAIERAKELRPDVVVLDFRLPDLDGHALAQVMRRELPDTTPIIIITGMREVTHAEDVDLTLNKPIASELFGGLIEYIRRRRFNMIRERPVR